MTVSRSFIRNLFSLLLITCLTSFPVSAAGRTSSGVSNTILNGKGAPTIKVGVNGDFYIDVLTFNIYGPKANNKWPTPVSLKGPSGNNGNDGKQGERGSAGTGVNGAQGDVGAQGIQGIQGEKGEKGEKGDKGEPGAKGATGATGATGLTGPQGLKGDTGATGSTGATGATGLQGLKGDTGATGSTGATGATGATGLQGIKGDTGLTGAAGANGTNGTNGVNGTDGTNGAPGATGATGPSNVYTYLVPSFTLSTSTSMGSAFSDPFGSFEANKSYSFSIVVRGQCASTTGIYGLTLSASGSGNSLLYDYATSTANDVRTNAEWKGYQFRVIGTLRVGSANSTLSVSIWDARGSSNSNSMTVTGTAVITLVGSVTNTPNI
jgi:hypothetical protein